MPIRNVWADEIKRRLDDVRARRTEVVKKLDEEERLAKEQCNHTYPDGRSAMTSYYDDEYNRDVAYCEVCRG